MLLVSLLEKKHDHARQTVVPSAFSIEVKDWHELVDRSLYPSWSECLYDRLVLRLHTHYISISSGGHRTFS